MRIVHFHIKLRLESGGVVRAVIDLCTLLAANGHDVTILTTDDRDAPEAWKHPTPGAPKLITVAPPSRPGRIFTRAQRKDLAKHLAGADVVHLHGLWGPYNTQLAAIARRAGIPYVVSAHGMLDHWCMRQGAWKKRLYHLAFESRTLRGAAFVHCTARAELEQSARWFPANRGRVVPLVFDVAPFRELPGPGPARAALPALESNRPVVLFLSRLHPKKGVERLIHASSSLTKREPRPLLVIAGSGEEAYRRRLESLTRSLAFEDDVIFAGFVDGITKVSLYQAADVYALPTSQENFGFVLFEAMAAGTPVVTTRGADTWPELESSGGARIVNGDPDALAEAIGALLDDPARRREMGRAGREWVLRNLDGTAIVRQFEQLYAEARSN